MHKQPLCWSLEALEQPFALSAEQQLEPCGLCLHLPQNYCFLSTWNCKNCDGSMYYKEEHTISKVWFLNFPDFLVIRPWCSNVLCTWNIRDEPRSEVCLKEWMSHWVISKWEWSTVDQCEEAKRGFVILYGQWDTAKYLSRDTLGHFCSTNKWDTHTQGHAYIHKCTQAHTSLEVPLLPE